MIEKAIHKYLSEQKVKTLTPKAVLFDMDGVLYNSMKYHAIAWLETAKEIGIPMETKDVYAFEGQTGPDTIKYIYERANVKIPSKEERDLVYHKKTIRFRQINDGEPMPGALDVLKDVQASGIKQLLVTGSGQDSLINKLNHDFPNHFIKAEMTTGKNVTHGKPNAEPYLLGLEKAGKLKCNEAFVVENAPLGVQAGKAAHIFTIAVNTGPLPDSALLEAGADLLFPDMETLHQNWKHIMQVCKSL